MTTIAEIEAAIDQLSHADRVQLYARLAERDAADWDRQLEEDIAAGKLKKFADEARKDAQAGRCTEL